MNQIIADFELKIIKLGVLTASTIGRGWVNDALIQICIANQTDNQKSSGLG